MRSGAKASDAPVNWRTRAAALRNIRPLARMVWETSPPLLIASVLLRVARALLPVATLWVFSHWTLW